MRAIVLYLCLTIVSGDVFACTCVPVSDRERVKNTETIFAGKVLQIDTVRTFFEEIKYNPESKVNDTVRYSGMSKMVTFQVQEWFKGDWKTDTINVTTGMGNGDCGFEFVTNARYLVLSSKQQLDFLNRCKSDNDYIRKEILYTSLCSKTTYATVENLRVIKQLLKKGRRVKGVLL